MQPKQIQIVLTIFMMSLLTLDVHAENAKISNKEVCKAAMATINFKHPREISVDKTENNIVYLSYIRSADRTKWSIICKIENNEVIWASIFNSNSNYDKLHRKTSGTSLGRWRNNAEDPKITFTVINNLIDVKETYGDGSSTTKSFDVEQLRK